jgi:hypothetical protein
LKQFRKSEVNPHLIHEVGNLRQEIPLTKCETALRAVANMQKRNAGKKARVRPLTKSSPLAGTFDSLGNASQTLAATDRS